MTSAECFRCGSLTSNTFGNGYICGNCIPENGDALPESDRLFENTPDTTSENHETSTGCLKGPVYPAAMRERAWWVTWILDSEERKRPVAPWETGHAYPAEWRGDLPDDECPETDFETAKNWTEFPLEDLGLVLPEDTLSNELRLGVILPVDRLPRDERVALID